METRHRTRSARRILVAILLGLVTLGSQTACEPEDPEPPSDGTPSVLADFDAFVEERLCSNLYDTDCLELLTHSVCRSGCPRSGYSHRWQEPGKLDLHLTLSFLRKLRNAANAYPDAVTTHSLGMSLSDLVWTQVQMFLTHPSARFYDADRMPLSAGEVRTNRNVDPTLFDSVTWVTGGGSAHAMVQADFGLWLLTLARGMPAGADLYLRLSERVFRSFGIPHDEGGVRNVRRGNRCFDGMYCYWFHSFPAGDEPYPMTVLNQHLHAVRDALSAHKVLSEWRDYGVTGPDGLVYALPGEFDSDHIDHLRDWGRGGLFQLAYAPSNEVIANAPPNLADFLAPDSSIDGVQRYRAYYRYEIGVGPRDISASSTCGYHYHSIKLLADILIEISGSPVFSENPLFVGLYHKLLYGRDAGDTRSCNNRSYIPPSRKVMRGLPLAELYFGSLVDQPFQDWCSSSDPEEWRSGTGDFQVAAPFYDSAYEGCEF